MGRGLLRAVAQFRYLGYAMLGLGLVALDFVGPAYWVWFAAFIFGWPLCIHVCARRCADYQHGLRLLQAFENLVGPACAALIQFPAAQFMALLVSLISGNIAQGGLKRLPEALLASAMGWMLGDWTRVRFGVDLTLAGTALSDFIGYAHILLFAALISAAGYERTMRVHESRVTLKHESKQLRAFNNRIAKYVDPGLSRRLSTSTEHQLPHRRLWVSACFVDLVGFTHMTSRMPPEAVCEVVNLFLARMAGLASRQGGRMDKFLGDGVLVTFGDLAEPLVEGPSSEGPARAETADAMLAFALRVPESMTDLNGELDRLALSMRLQVRMGAASGYCTVGDFGEGDRLDYTVIGPAVNLASRLEALAPVDGLLIDEATHKLASAKVQRSHWGEHQIKGVPDPVSLCSVTFS